MDESTLLEEINTWEHPLRYGSDQFKERVIVTFLENQKGLFHHLTTHFWMWVKRFLTFRPCQESSLTAITLNPESNFTRREKNHSLFHSNTLTYPELLIRIWMSSKRSALMILGISMGEEICVIRGQVSHNLLYSKKKLLTDMWSGERLTRKQLTSRPDHLWPELWKSMGKHAKLKEKQKWSRQRIQGYQLLLLCLSKLCRRIVGVVHPIESRTKLACILEADESARLRMGNSIPKYHEDHIAGKGDNSLQHLNLVH